MFKKIVFVLLFIFLSTLGYLFFRGTRSNTPRKNKLIVGTASGYAPFVSVNEQGEYEGFDIDVARELAKAMGRELELKDLGSMASLFMALNQGTIDVIMWGLSITQERLARVVMINYQGERTSSYPLLFWEKIPAGIQSIGDMAGMTVCVEPASAQDAVLSRYSSINKMPTERVDDALLNIQYGKADAAFVEPAIARKFMQKYSEIKTISVPLIEEEQELGVGIALVKTNSSLITEVQKAVDDLKRAGTMKKYETKWGLV